MAVYNLGSINLDHFYRVPHIPAPGETIAATGHSAGLGGKGANQSVAVAKAGGTIWHIGMVGSDGADVLARMRALGVDPKYVGTAKDTVTGHANVHVDAEGENAIVVLPGANHKQSLTLLETALSAATAGDIFLMQNEVSLREDAARLARENGLFVMYSAAPFKADVVRGVLPYVDLLVLNAVEARQLSDALGVTPEAIPVPQLLITRGANGATWRDQATGDEVSVPAFPVDPVDTTGAGDCFAGYVAAGLDEGLDHAAAMRLASAASALQVTRPGTADAIPERADVDAFLREVAK